MNLGQVINENLPLERSELKASYILTLDIVY